MRLARAARVFGIDRFEAEVLAENPEMVAVFRGSGFPVEVTWTGASCHVTFPIAHDPPPARPSRLGGDALVRCDVGMIRT